MKKKKPTIKDKEKIILQHIHNFGSGTANEISEATGISYITVKKYLFKLVKDKILVVEDDKEKKKNS